MGLSGAGRLRGKGSDKTVNRGTAGGGARCVGSPRAERNSSLALRPAPEPQLTTTGLCDPLGDWAAWTEEM